MKKCSIGPPVGGKSKIYDKKFITLVTTLATCPGPAPNLDKGANTPSEWPVEDE